jgi:flagellar basal-body rod protein FlgF
MDNTLYVAVSRQMILRRELEVVANNVANADTAGFKVESVISQTDPHPVVLKGMAPSNVKYALDTGLARDFGQGSLSQTGAPLDMAIQGDGFFQVNTANGPRYTRDGRFTSNPQGQVTDAKGNPIADDAGQTITLDPAKGPPSISADGIVSQNGQRIAKIGIYRFGSMSGLSKTGDGMFRNDSNQTAQAATDARVSQGFFESSNVQPVIEITRMTEISREYERISRLMDQTADLDSKSIDRLGRVN